MSASYLLAKHIPDMHRFEPRNIGVIVWMPGGEVAARFLAEKPDRPGEIDGRSIPPFVGADGAYRQWIKFWRSYLDADHPTHPLTGAPIDRNDAAFMESLIAASRGHFLLAEGGEVLDEMEEDSIGALADNLYASLVEDQALEEARDPTLNQICERLIGNAGLYLDQNFKPHYQVACRVGGVEERYEFSYAYKNGTLKRLYQQVSVPKRKKLLEKNSRSSAWMFEHVLKAGIIADKADVTALVHVTDENRADSDVQRALGVLAEVGRVINVADENTAKEEFESLPLLAGH